MKIKEGFMLRDIAESWVVVPIGQSLVDFNGLMTLNESGVVLWKKLEKGSTKEELISAIQEEYDIDQATAKIDVDEFLSILINKNIIV